jgi:hypothetical protein
VLVTATFKQQNISCAQTWSSNQSGAEVILALSSFLNQIPHQEPEYLVPHEDNSIQLLSTVRTKKWKNNFVVHLKVCQLIK